MRRRKPARRRVTKGNTRGVRSRKRSPPGRLLGGAASDPAATRARVLVARALAELEQRRRPSARDVKLLAAHADLVVQLGLAKRARALLETWGRLKQRRLDLAIAMLALSPARAPRAKRSK